MNRVQAILLLAVIGLSGFYVWGKKHHIEVQERDFEAKRYFPGQKEDTIKSIEVKCSDPVFAYTLRQIYDSWYLDGHLASLEKSPQLASSLIELGTEKIVQTETTPENDKEYGLEKPSYTISLVAKNNKDLGTVILGHRTPGGNHYYGRRLSGGAIATVPAYTLSPLEVEPKDLREMSALPVEVPAVDRFEFKVNGQTSIFTRPQGKDDGFLFDSERGRQADETKVKDLIFQLRDSKVARFLGDKESTDLGSLVAQFRAHLDGAKVDWVTQFCQPVSVNHKLRYGRRFMAEVGKEQPVAGTEERFVIGLENPKAIFDLKPEDFEDRRIARLDIDKVSAVTIEHLSNSIELEHLPQGGWVITKPQERRDETFPSSNSEVDKLLWALRDLRYIEIQPTGDSLGDSAWVIRIKNSKGNSLEYRLGQSKSGKSVVRFENRDFLLKQELVSNLDKAATALLATPSSVSPTPAQTP